MSPFAHFLLCFNAGLRLWHHQLLTSFFLGFRIAHIIIADKALKSIGKRMWYLMEELVPLGLGLDLIPLTQ